MKGAERRRSKTVHPCNSVSPRAVSAVARYKFAQPDASVGVHRLKSPEGGRQPPEHPRINRLDGPFGPEESRKSQKGRKFNAKSIGLISPCRRSNPHDFARVHDALGIKRALQGAHGLQSDGGFVPRDLVDLCLAQPMLRADRAFEGMNQ